MQVTRLLWIHVHSPNPKAFMFFLLTLRQCSMILGMLSVWYRCSINVLALIVSRHQYLEQFWVSTLISYFILTFYALEIKISLLLDNYMHLTKIKLDFLGVLIRNTIVVMKQCHQKQTGEEMVGLASTLQCSPPFSRVILKSIEKNTFVTASCRAFFEFSDWLGGYSPLRMVLYLS
jgi:hypothetical protein